MGWILTRERLLLTLLCALLYLPGIGSIPPLDRDESRFAQASKQMIETGDFIGIYFQDEPRNKKPAGIHWLQAAAVGLFGHGPHSEISLYRLPSVIGAWLAVLFTFGIGCTLFNRTTALWGAALLGCCVALVAEAHMATTDAVLLAAVTAAQWMLARAYLRARGEASDLPLRWPAVFAFWSALGIGVLIKGPVVLLVALLTVATLSVSDSWRWLRALRPSAGLVIFALWVLPWFLAVTFLTPTHFVTRAVAEDILPKLLGGQESHGGPPGYYFVLMSVFLWPASLFVLPALWAAWQARRSPAVRFCLAWVVPTWIFFELVPTKLPHYVLPTYPALTLLIAAALRDLVQADFSSRLARWSAALWATITVGLAVGLSVAGWTLGDGSRWWVIASGAALLASAILPSSLLIRRYPQRAAMAAVGLAAVTLPCLAALYAPRLAKLWLSPAIAAAVERAAIDPNPFVVSSDYHEPSLVFLLGTRTILTDAAGAAIAAADHPGSFAIVASPSEEQFLGEIARRGVATERVATIAGLNYTKGQPLLLTLFRVGGK